MYQLLLKRVILFRKNDCFLIVLLKNDEFVLKGNTIKHKLLLLKRYVKETEFCAEAGDPTQCDIADFLSAKEGCYSSRIKFFLGICAILPI